MFSKLDGLRSTLAGAFNTSVRLYSTLAGAFNWKPLAIAAIIITTSVSAVSAQQLLNVSYDPTRELYQDYNGAFARYWKAKTGQNISVRQSHGGSGKQARSVIDGLEADVVTLALAYDIDAISQAGLIKPDWKTKLPDNSSPYTSTIVFVVRKGNPKRVHDWADLVRPGVSIVTPNPKTGGGARWNFLAAYGYALKQPGGNDAKARDFVTRLYRNVAVLDSGARGATTTFTQRGVGDVLIAWENEALLIKNNPGGNNYEVITPSVSILAEPPIAVVDSVVDKHHTRPIATAYLQYLYSKEGQTIAARHYYRPRNKAILKQYSKTFLKTKLFTIDKVFGGWQNAQRIYFANGGVFDQIFRR